MLVAYPRLKTSEVMANNVFEAYVDAQTKPVSILLCFWVLIHVAANNTGARMTPRQC